ncbi:hypothetical protein [Saccharopolyspora dendranthemae]|uniref:Uncharacterized protein n=1 Tax=Saccharopolyspora dendranthemae TaxID=1181886 RepID=A0A561VBP3_9PSEU|nr:hypothetical protein [Saccharopolyspora dendranthemae]TWG08967.1 hypothetical protein FHU35_111596 [Saccharopolyspora dendranthemae]
MHFQRHQLLVELGTCGDVGSGLVVVGGVVVVGGLVGGFVVVGDGRVGVGRGVVVVGGAGGGVADVVVVDVLLAVDVSSLLEVSELVVPVIGGPGGIGGGVV